MIPRGLILAPLVVIATLSAVATLQGRVDALKTRSFDQELLYLPNQHLLTYFTAGMAPVIADFLWLRTLSYTVEEFHGDGRFTWLSQMGEVITRLDPYFLNAYRYTGMFLAALKADDDASIDLLRSGIPHNPHAWQLPYEIGMVYLTNRRDEPDSALLAVQWFQAADATGTAPETARLIAEGLMQQHRMTDLERAMWEDVLRTSTDAFERAIAHRKLEEVAIREAVVVLNEAVTRFKDTHGHPPARFEDLVASGVLGAAPPDLDRLGGRFFIDEEGAVQNTTLLDLSVEHLRNQLEARIRSFQNLEGRLPLTLDELIVHGQLHEVPPHPYPDREWAYDSATGTVE